MDKWEYLSCTSSVTTTWIYTNLAFEQFAVAFPSQKVTSPHRGTIEIVWQGKAIEFRVHTNSILDYLGSQGWEAYAVSKDNLYHLKRRVSV